MIFILSIHKYLMVKNNIKECSIIGLLCFGKSVSSLANTANQVKCLS